jgi:hypothetical protein
MEITEAAFKPANDQSVIKPYVLSHGTMECYNLGESRRFYEEFLGMECVQHARRTMAVRCGMKFHIVCVQVGASVKPCGVFNHWGVDVETREEVDRAHAKALELKDKYKIRQVHDVVEQHGVYSFYIEDLDHNWWEVQHFEGFQHDDMFDFGDRFTLADAAAATA